MTAARPLAGARNWPSAGTRPAPSMNGRACAPGRSAGVAARPGRRVISA